MPNKASAVAEDAPEASFATETEVKSAETVSVSEEPAVGTEDVSSLTLAEISTTETSTGIIYRYISCHDLIPSFFVSVLVSHTKISTDHGGVFNLCPVSLTNALPAETSPPSEEQPSPVAEPTQSVKSAPSSEETSAPKAADEPAGIKNIPPRNMPSERKITLVRQTNTMPDAVNS